MSGSNNSNEGHGREQQPAHGDDEQGGGHSGEGAASAMAHMITQGQRQRRHQPEGDDRRGSQPA